MKHYHVVELHVYAPNKSYASNDITIVLDEDQAQQLVESYKEEFDQHERDNKRKPGFYSAGYYACEDTCDLSGLA